MPVDETAIGSGNGVLQNVTCPSASNCWAVGDLTVGSPGGETTSVLAYHWDGTAWSAPREFRLPTASDGTTRVACRATNDCWIIDGISAPKKKSSHSWHWNGKDWAAHALFGGRVALTSLTCSGAQCWVVADNGKRDQLYSLRGTTAKMAPVHYDLANTATVSCSHTAGCWYTGTPSTFQSLVDTLKLGPKGSWVRESPVFTRSGGGTLSCTGRCWYFTEGSNQGSFPAEYHYSRGWALSIFPKRFQIESISCATATSCIAVGLTLPSGDSTFTLVAHSVLRSGKWSPIQ